MCMSFQNMSVCVCVCICYIPSAISLMGRWRSEGKLLSEDICDSVNLLLGRLPCAETENVNSSSAPTNEIIFLWSCTPLNVITNFGHCFGRSALSAVITSTGLWKSTFSGVNCMHRRVHIMLLVAGHTMNGITVVTPLSVYYNSKFLWHISEARERGGWGVGWAGGLEPTLFEQGAPKLEGVNGSNEEPTLVNMW